MSREVHPMMSKNVLKILVSPKVSFYILNLAVTKEQHTIIYGISKEKYRYACLYAFLCFCNQKKKESSQKTAKLISPASDYI